MLAVLQIIILISMQVVLLILLNLSYNFQCNCTHLLILRLNLHFKIISLIYKITIATKTALQLYRTPVSIVTHQRIQLLLVFSDFRQQCEQPLRKWHRLALSMPCRDRLDARNHGKLFLLVVQIPTQDGQQFPTVKTSGYNASAN